jgi:hypothetical protein
MAREFLDQIRHELHRVRELILEQHPHPLHIGESVEAIGAAARQEERGRTAAIGVRQRDEHEAATRPDVQRVWLHRMVSAGCRWDRQLLVVVVEAVLPHGDEACALETGANGRSGAIGGKGGRKRYGALRTRGLVAIAQRVRGRQGCQAVVPESQPHPRVAGRFFYQHPVELAAAD